jgi:hypothetical protein
MRATAAVVKPKILGCSHRSLSPALLWTLTTGVVHAVYARFLDPGIPAWPPCE